MNSTQKQALELPEQTDSDSEALIPVTAGRDAINISGDTVTTKTAHLDDEERSLVRWAYDYARDNDWGWNLAAKELGVSSTTLYRIWVDKYRHQMVQKDSAGNKVPHPKAGERISLSSICETLADRKRLFDERATLRKVPFVETSVFKTIDKICEEALLSQTVAMIYGESQIGKTESLEEHRRRNNHGQTIYVRLPASAGVQLVMKEVAKACRVSPDSSFEHLRDRVHKAIDGTKLLIIDELHEVFECYQKKSIVRVLEVIREIFDRTKCGLVLCGTRVFRENLETGHYAQFLKQLRRRGVLEAQLPDVAPVPDLNAFAAAYGLPPLKVVYKEKKLVGQDAAADLVLAIAKEYGLGRYIKTLARGARRATKKTQRYTWDHFLQAYDFVARLKDNPNAS
jgi:DNA transposition AAA+ family ATPase